MINVGLSMERSGASDKFHKHNIVRFNSHAGYYDFLHTDFVTRALKCQTLGCAVCHKKSTHFIVATVELMNRPGFFLCN